MRSLMKTLAPLALALFGAVTLPACANESADQAGYIVRAVEDPRGGGADQGQADQIAEQLGLDGLRQLEGQEAEEALLAVRASADYEKFLAKQGVAAIGSGTATESVRDGVLRWHFNVPVGEGGEVVTGTFDATHAAMQKIALVRPVVLDGEAHEVVFQVFDASGTMTQFTLEQLDEMKEATGGGANMGIDWAYWVCQFSGKTSCLLGCLVFVEAPPVMTACNWACGYFWSQNVCK
jgi:hypothetical protein